MNSIASASATLSRIVQTSLACLLFFCLTGSAQQALPKVQTGSSSIEPTIPTKKLQVVRPFERQGGRWRGVPWMDGPAKPAELAPAPGTLLHGSQQEDMKNTPRVSGWWSIDVKNPDGSVALHREFENDYATNIMIPYLLGGKIVAGEPSIQFGAGTGQGPYSTPGDPRNFTSSPCNGTNGCLISEVAGGYWNTLSQCSQNPGSCASGLTMAGTAVTVVNGSGATFGNAPALELNGQITAQTSNTIGYVETKWTACSEAAPSDTSPVTGLNPAACAAQNANLALIVSILTYTGLGNPISVSAGQVIHIKVDIAFIDGDF